MLDLHLDTSTPTGRFTLTILTAVAELEREQIRERTRQGLAAAKRRGVRLGRPVSAETRTAASRAAETREEGARWRKVADVL